MRVFRYRNQIGFCCSFSFDKLKKLIYFEAANGYRFLSRLARAELLSVIILVMELLCMAKERLLDWSINPKKTKQKRKRFLFTIVVARLYLPT